jgi:AraC family transcriptional regulator of adaptative response/methylated-DNA-[protein]-cysteine methyltransferase
MLAPSVFTDFSAARLAVMTPAAVSDPDHARYAEDRYAAVVARDQGADGSFFYGVRTTGVVCRPSCASRTPKRENVSFHDTVADAIAAGFRPCKRCHPESLDAGTPQAQLHADVVTAVCREIDRTVHDGTAAPTLAQLSERTGFSPFHLQRLFKRATGTTPREYATAARAQRMQTALERSRSVSEAMHTAGYSSSSRLYEQSTQRMGMTPSQSKRGGGGETIRFAVGETSLGTILVAATTKGICAIQLGDDPDALVRALDERFPNATLVGDDASFAQTVARVVALVESPTTTLDLPLDIRGTAFQQRVWRALTTIAAGTTWTYTELAAVIGQPRAVRAVASACAANEIAIAIPCHRVVRASGELAGYRWGIDRKSMLLTRERATIAR